MTFPDSKTHAVVVPWPLRNLQTWCGQPAKNLETVDTEHFISCAPETVTCEKCRSAMRQALKNLQEWVPHLPSNKSPEEPQSKETRAFICLRCMKVISDTEADKSTFPASHRNCGGELAVRLDIANFPEKGDE